MIIGKPLLILTNTANYPYLTFSSEAPFTLACSSPQWDGTLQYSTDASVWTAWDGSTIQSAAGMTANVIYLRGTGNTKIAGSNAARFIISDDYPVSASGNIEALLDCATVARNGHPTMAASCFAYLFSNCVTLTAAPTLPAVTLSANCYQSMFENCVSLTAPHVFPVGDFPQYACRRMYYGCSSIRLNTTPGSPYTYSYRVSSETASPTVQSGSFTDMFTNTGGVFTGTPSPGTVYYCTAQPYSA